MKTFLLSLFLMLAQIICLKAQDSSNISFPLIGETAPSFTAESTMGTIHFPQDYFNKWKILFSHPADFTAVCSSEIIALASMQDDFEKLNTRLIVLSTDGLNSHIEWSRSLESVKLADYPEIKIRFPLISDSDRSISRLYGMIHKHLSSTKTVRAVFIINPDNKVAAIFYYPNNVGRNMDEIKRTLIALQTTEKYSVLTPANRNVGENVMIPSPKTIEESQNLEDKIREDNKGEFYKAAWYMWYKKLPEAGK